MIYREGRQIVENAVGDVYVAGQRIQFQEWSVEIPAYDQSDNFTIIAPWEVGGDGVLASNAQADTALISAKNIPAKVVLKGKALINGLVDKPSWSFVTDEEKVTILGRGKIARMLERKEIRNIKNRTASSVMEEIFRYHGISGIVKPTSTHVGVYSESGYGANSAVNMNQDDWQLSNWLAEQEGFVVRVRGEWGYFGPYDELPTPHLPPMQFTYGKDNFEIQDISRDGTGTRDIIVEGRSYYKKRTIIAHWPRAPKAEGEEAVVKRYTLTNLSEEQLRRRVRSIYEEITKKDLTATLYFPYHVDIETDRRVELFGVGRGLSTVYYVSRVKLNENIDGISTEMEICNKMPFMKGGL